MEIYTSTSTVENDKLKKIKTPSLNLTDATPVKIPTKAATASDS